MSTTPAQTLLGAVAPPAKTAAVLNGFWSDFLGFLRDGYAPGGGKMDAHNLATHCAYVPWTGSAARVGFPKASPHYVQAMVSTVNCVITDLMAYAGQVSGAGLGDVQIQLLVNAVHVADCVLPAAGSRVFVTTSVAQVVLVDDVVRVFCSLTNPLGFATDVSFMVLFKEELQEP